MNASTGTHFGMKLDEKHITCHYIIRACQSTFHVTFIYISHIEFREKLLPGETVSLDCSLLLSQVHKGRSSKNGGQLEQTTEVDIPISGLRLSVCLSVCLYVPYGRPNRSADRLQTLHGRRGTSCG